MAACIKSFPPTYIPTCPIDVFDEPLNINISPGCKLFFETATPFFIWPFDDLFKLIPKCLYTYVVNPEQSNPVDGDEPPATYLYPKYFFANSTTSFPSELVALAVLSSSCSSSVSTWFSSTASWLATVFSSEKAVVLSYPPLAVVSGNFVSDTYFCDTYPIWSL